MTRHRKNTILETEPITF